MLERVLRSNLIGSFLATKHFAPLMNRAARTAPGNDGAEPG